MVCKRVFLSGKVQGVSYRYHAHEKATLLKLQGWVQNLDDGRVEILAAGPEDAVTEMIDWARRGPRHAEVSGIEISDESEIPTDPFYIRRKGRK